ncbi:MAG: nucleotide exchange factor GrpE [Oscillospiraceae bacterium]
MSKEKINKVAEDEKAKAPPQEEKEVNIKSKKENVLKEENDKMKAEIEQLNDKILRHYAEFDNYKKRTSKEKSELSSYVKINAFKDLLGVVDNFERALACECQDENFKKGMEMILNQLNEYLKNQGVSEVEALGKEFNPDMHNAISQVEDENLGENIVAQVFSKGYVLEDKVIRHAMVVVANCN